MNKKCTVGGGGKKKKKHTEMTGRAENRKQKMEEFGQARLEGSERGRNRITVKGKKTG